MTKDIDIDSKIKYFENEVEKSGVVVGLRKEEIDGVEQVTAYLVDTGEIERSETYEINLRKEEIFQRVVAEIEALPPEERFAYNPNEAAERINKEKGLPKDKVTEVTTNYPVIVEILPSAVKAGK